MEFIATAAFGLEGLVKQELQALGFEAKAEPGGARFSGGMAEAFKANLWLACADRVMWVLGEQEALTFDALFEFVKSIPWEDILPRDAAFPVSGNCARSQLMSISDCQSITKKAIVERLKQRHKTQWFPETGPVFPISVTLHRDVARLAIDTSGDALNRRGFRTYVGEAPIRETLAAALVRLSGWQTDQPLHDPCCGSGTLLLEAAFLAANRASGLARSFIMETWSQSNVKDNQRLREEAASRCRFQNIPPISGSDISPEALTLCTKHLRQADLFDKVKVRQADLRQLNLEGPAPFFIANPPYGERLGDKKASDKLAADFGGLLARHPGAKLAVITANHGFERHMRRKAISRRRLYNGRLECEFLVF
ncbi:MAG: THUMP domain-containing class I SAM-dependent RNA methyltransferase [Christensenellales bacterium]|jgi:putative N6-adenine-specific DNA methylase